MPQGAIHGLAELDDAMIRAVGKRLGKHVLDAPALAVRVVPIWL